MAAALVGIYHIAFAGKESYLSSVNISYEQWLLLSAIPSNAILCSLSRSLSTHPEEVEDPLQLVPVQLCG